MNEKDIDETLAAWKALTAARALVRGYALPQDHDAATVALLVRAVELAAPDLSPTGRASLFMETEND